MDYIEKIIQFIETNIHRISIKEVDGLREPFNISSSKFKRDFKRAKGTTPRDWLMGKKIELAHNYKSEDPVLTIKEVVLKIGWDLTDRQFSEIYKVHYGMTFGGKAINKDYGFSVEDASEEENRMDNDFLFSKEKKDLEEIIFRMVLLSGGYTIKDPGELCKTIVSNIENTCFRFPFLTFEKEFVFSVFFDPDDPDQLSLSTVFTRMGAPNLCFIPNNKGIYLDLIYNVAINQERKIQKSILESISNWDDMTNMENNMIIEGYQQRIYDKHTHPKINKDAGVFRYSQECYDYIIKEFREEYEALLDNIHIREIDLTEYIRALKEINEPAIGSALGKLIGKGAIKLLPEKLDLLLQLAECPYIGHINFAEYTFGMDKDLIDRVIEKYPPNLIPELIYEYFSAYRTVEDDGEYHGNSILLGIMERISNIDL